MATKAPKFGDVVFYRQRGSIKGFRSDTLLRLGTVLVCSHQICYFTTRFGLDSYNWKLENNSIETVKGEGLK